jgi:hypothetical protein
MYLMRVWLWVRNLSRGKGPRKGSRCAIVHTPKGVCNFQKIARYEWRVNARVAGDKRIPGREKWIFLSVFPVLLILEGRYNIGKLSSDKSETTKYYYMHKARLTNTFNSGIRAAAPDLPFEYFAHSARRKRVFPRKVQATLFLQFCNNKRKGEGRAGARGSKRQ